MKWSPNEVELVEMCLASGGYKLLMERLDQREAAAMRKLRHPDSGIDEVNVARGNLLAIEFMRPAQIQNEITHHETTREQIRHAEEARTNAR